MMTPEELKEIKERADKATPGPWSMEHCDYALGGFLDDLFIAHAREDIPKLVAEIDRLRKALKFYAGMSNDARWEGPTLLTFDKYGGLCEEISGPCVARAALGEGEK